MALLLFALSFFVSSSSKIKKNHQTPVLKFSVQHAANNKTLTQESKQAIERTIDQLFAKPTSRQTPLSVKLSLAGAYAQCWNPPSLELAGVEGAVSGSVKIFPVPVMRSKSPKITLLTVAANLPHKYTAGLIVNRLKEASQHDYEYCHFSAPLSSSRDLAWSKVRAIQALQANGRTTVVLMDADALFMNFRPFEQILTDSWKKNKDMVVTTELGDPFDVATPYSAINTGVLVTRTSKWSSRFWESIWNDFPEAIDDAWWEQRAVLNYRERYPADFHAHVDIIPSNWMNMHLERAAYHVSETVPQGFFKGIAWIMGGDAAFLHRFPDFAAQHGLRVQEKQYDAFVVHVANGHFLNKYTELTKRFVRPGSSCCWINKEEEVELMKRMFNKTVFNRGDDSDGKLEAWKLQDLVQEFVANASSRTHNPIA